MRYPDGCGDFAREKYGSGEMLTSEVKKILIEVLQKLLGDFQVFTILP